MVHRNDILQLELLDEAIDDPDGAAGDDGDLKVLRCLAKRGRRAGDRSQVEIEQYLQGGELMSSREERIPASWNESRSIMGA